MKITPGVTFQEYRASIADWYELPMARRAQLRRNFANRKSVVTANAFGMGVIEFRRKKAQGLVPRKAGSLLRASQAVPPSEEPPSIDPVSVAGFTGGGSGTAAQAAGGIGLGGVVVGAILFLILFRGGA